MMISPKITDIVYSSTYLYAHIDISSSDNSPIIKIEDSVGVQEKDWRQDLHQEWERLLSHRGNPSRDCWEGGSLEGEGVYYKSEEQET